MSNNTQQVKYVTESGLKTTMNNFLSKLKDWLPIKKAEDKIVITTPTYKNAMEIDANGEIYVIGTNNNPTNLRNWIDSKGTIVVETYEDALFYCEEKYLGSLIYLKIGDSEHNAGLYAVGINSHGGNIMLVKLGTTTSSTEDLGLRVDKIEDWMSKPLSNNDLNILTDDDPTNDNQI